MNNISVTPRVVESARVSTVFQLLESTVLSQAIWFSNINLHPYIVGPKTGPRRVATMGLPIPIIGGLFNPAILAIVYVFCCVKLWLGRAEGGLCHPHRLCHPHPHPHRLRRIDSGDEGLY